MKNKIADLTSSLIYHRELYDNQQPEIYDFQYDEMFQQLLTLEIKFPEFALDESPTKNVGSMPLKEFQKVIRKTPMLSIKNAFTDDDVKSFVKSINTDRYICETKFDGVSGELIYKKGILTQSSTRGNGLVGEDITNNSRLINNIPLTLKMNIDIIIRGEILILKEDFIKINKQQKSQGLELFKNARNLASGTIKSLDPKTVKDRYLTFFAFDFINLEKEEHLIYHKSKLSFLNDLGFQTNYRIADNYDDILKWYNYFNENRINLPYDIDGMVIKVDNIKKAKELGNTSHHPRSMVSWKFKADEVPTIVNDIIWQVGRTGIITPVAILEPVEISGSIVSKATLNNVDIMIEKGVMIGCEVLVRKSGEIIPEIVKVIHTTSVKPQIPNLCPVCQFTASYEGAYLKCNNSDCPAKLKGCLSHFASRDAMNIMALGDKIIDALVDQNHVKSIFNLYYLTSTNFSELTGLPMGLKLSSKILTNIHNTINNIEFDKFLYSLGIPHIGRSMSKQLGLIIQESQFFKNNIVIDEYTLSSLEGIGILIAYDIYEYLACHGDEIKGLYDHIKPIDVKVEIKNEGLNVCCTGKLDMPRKEIEKILIGKGYVPVKSVNKSTDILIVGDKPGSKVAKAKKLEIKIVGEEFLK